MEFKINHFASLDSTNLWLKRAVAEGSSGVGTVVQADVQTLGRGRLGRSWDSPPGESLLFSVLLNPLLPETNLPLISLLSSLAVVDGIQDQIGKNGNLALRWPNDVLYGQKKLCGILCESSKLATGSQYIIAGIGLNVNQTEEHFQPDFRTPATSLYLITGVRRDPLKLLPPILRSLAVSVERIERAGWRWIAREWIERAGIIGNEVEVADGAQRISGQVADILPDGALVLKMGDGVMRTVHSGEVF